MGLDSASYLFDIVSSTIDYLFSLNLTKNNSFKFVDIFTAIEIVFYLKSEMIMVISMTYRHSKSIKLINL